MTVKASVEALGGLTQFGIYGGPSSPGPILSSSPSSSTYPGTGPSSRDSLTSPIYTGLLEHPPFPSDSSLSSYRIQWTPEVEKYFERKGKWINVKGMMSYHGAATGTADPKGSEHSSSSAPHNEDYGDETEAPPILYKSRQR